MAIIRVLGAVIWSVLMISSSLVLILFTWNPKYSVTQARTMWAPGILWVCGVRLKVYGAQHLDKNASYVFVSNHQSYLDIPFLFRAIPLNLYFVAKKELKKIPFLGWYMMATGMIFIDRSNRLKSVESLRKAARLIHDGKSVIMFPEGTRSKNGQLAPFKKGPFMLARQAKVGVVPVGIYEPKGHFQLTKLKSTPIEVHIGQPISFDQQGVEEVIRSVHDEVAVLSRRGKQEIGISQ